MALLVDNAGGFQMSNMVSEGRAGYAQLFLNLAYGEPFVARAYASGRTDLVERAVEGFRVGKGKKDKRVAVHNALAILAGRTQKIWRPE